MVKQQMAYLRHLNSRGLAVQGQVEGYSVDLDNEVTDFMLWNMSGQLVGYQRYKWQPPKMSRNPKEGKYFTRLTKGKLAVWGLHSYKSNEPLYIVEGIFDAVSMHIIGKACVAVLTNSPKHLKNWFRCLPNKTIAILDGDSAGKSLAALCDEAIQLPDDQDANSMDFVDLYTLVNPL